MDLPEDSLKEKIQDFNKMQADVDKMRKDIMDNTADIFKDNFEFIEKFVDECGKRNLPFMLFVNPFGYNFNKEKNRGYYRYQKFHGNTEPFSEESIKNLKISTDPLFKAVINFFRAYWIGIDIKITPKNDNTH